MAQLPRGVALSGLEFGDAIPGVEGIDFFRPSNTDIDYFANKGFNLLRIPFKWERIQPVLGGALDATYLSYVDAAIAHAKTRNIQVIIECHNFGGYFIYQSGGFTSNFTSTDALWLGGSQGSGVGSIANFQRMLAGNINNPVSPASSYIVTADIRVDAVNGADVWRALWFEFYRVDDNNKYFFTLNTTTDVWELFKVVNGVQTQLATGSQTFNVGTFYTIVLDINQTTPGKINLTIGGVQKANVNSDAALTHGQISLFSNGVNGSIDNVTLNVNGDTSNGRTNTQNYNIDGADGNVTIAHFANLWSRLSSHYQNETGIIAYDLMNEPHGMKVPTTPSNYNTTSTITLMHQAAVNAIRANNDTHQIFVETDEFSGLQNFVSQYGANPTWWINDPLNKTGLSCHYYPDSNHSGSTFASSGFSSTYFTRVDTEVPPALIWAHTNGIKMFIGEYGIADNSLWYPTLDKILAYMDTYFAWGTYWAGGVFYSAETTVEPTSNYTVDLGQMPTLLAHLPQEEVIITPPPPIIGTGTIGTSIGLLLALTYATGSGTTTPTPHGPIWLRRKSTGPKWSRA